MKDLKMNKELPPRQVLENFSNFHCETCDYEVGVGEKYARYNKKTEFGVTFEFVCLHCAKQDEPLRPRGV